MILDPHPENDALPALQPANLAMVETEIDPALHSQQQQEGPGHHPEKPSKIPPPPPPPPINERLKSPGQ